VPDVDPLDIDLNARMGSDCLADDGERNSRWAATLDSMKSKKVYDTKQKIFNVFCQTQPSENTVIMNVVQWIKHRCEEKDSSGKACHRPTSVWGDLSVIKKWFRFALHINNLCEQSPQIEDYLRKMVKLQVHT
jgi:hypothetical protein